MFDNVGKNLDEDATKRSFASVLISSLILAGGAAFTIGWGAYKVVETVTADPIDDEMVEVFIADDSVDEAPPPPPPPPPPPAAADDVEEDDDQDDTNETEEMVEEIRELVQEVKTEIKSVTRPKGVKDGVEGGVEGGQLGGVKDGVKDGVIGGQLGGGGLRVFHHTDLDTKRTRNPRYPEEAQPLNLGEQMCRVRVRIDEDGVPYDVEISGCPKVFHQATREAILWWRWYPPRDESRKKVKAETMIAVKYKP